MWRKLASLSRTIFRRSRMESEMAEELRCHIAERADHLIQQGAPPGEALRQARLEFGAVEAYMEECRASRGAAWIDELWRNLRYAGRSLHQRPGYAAVAILSLALGIGANVAVFSLLNRLVLTPLPVRDPETLQYVYLSRSQFDRLSYLKFERLRENFDLFETLFGWTWGDYELTFENRTRLVDVDLVTGDYFVGLGVRSAHGRLLLPEDDRAGAAQGIVLSHRFWREFFRGDESVLGRSVQLHNLSFEIVGVAPPDFLGLEPGSPPDAYISFRSKWRFNPDYEPGEGAMILFTMGRLKPGVALQAAQTELREMWPSLQPPPPASAGYYMDPQFVLLRDGSRGYSPLRMEFSQSLYVLMGLAAAVFLIASANLVSLLIVRGIERRGETSMRITLGASRRQLVWQWMTECLLIAAIGGVAGLILARWISESLLLFVNESDRAWLRFRPEPAVLAVALGLTVAAALLIGLLPAFRAYGSEIQSLIKEHTAAVIGHRGRIAHAVLATQVAIALMLVISAGLFTRTLWKLSHTDPGLDTGGLAYAWPQFWKTEFPRDRVRPIIDEAVERLRMSPNLVSVSEARGLPFAFGADASGYIRRVPGYTFAPGEQNHVFHKIIGLGYFKTLGIPLKRGRDFRPGEWSEESPRVAIVNERFARHYFGDRNPLGQEFQSGDAMYRIVGVAGDTTDENYREQPREMIYRIGDPQRGYAPIVARTKPGVEADVGEDEIRAMLTSLAPGIPIDSGTLEGAVYESLRRDRLVAQLSSAFGVLGMLLAAVGLYGATANLARSRRREIGLRIALGAVRSDIVRLILRQNVRVTLVGVAFGIALALAAGRLIESLLFGITATDPLAFAVAALLLATVALAATLWPALRAAKLDPSQTLRYE